MVNVLLRLYKLTGGLCFTSQEWVTDNPLVISPRISFEVSVRLLGGLMALGYTIATILKRRSHVLADDRVCLKIDWLEQLNRQYVQVKLCNFYLFVIVVPLFSLSLSLSLSLTK